MRSAAAFHGQQLVDMSNATWVRVFHVLHQTQLDQLLQLLRLHQAIVQLTFEANQLTQLRGHPWRHRRGRNRVIHVLPDTDSALATQLRGLIVRTSAALSARQLCFRQTVRLIALIVFDQSFFDLEPSQQLDQNGSNRTPLSLSFGYPSFDVLCHSFIHVISFALKATILKNSQKEKLGDIFGT